MSKTAGKIQTRARLSRPATPKGATWTFLVLPKVASTKLHTRAMVTVEGTLNGAAFLATLEPDGQGSHWLKVSRKLRESAAAVVGDDVALEFATSDREPEPRLPADLRKALEAAPKAKTVWSEITTKARRDWIQWITSPKKAETRARRIDNACEMLVAGKRRACCFDRSGIYSRGLGAPEAAN